MMLERQKPGAGSVRVKSILLHALVALLLLAPVAAALHFLDWDALQFRHLVASIGLLALLIGLSSLLPRALGITLLASGLAAMGFVRMLFYGIVQFSGAGFSSELFIHLEPRSFELAWQQYRGLFLVLFALLLAAPFLARALLRARWHRRRARLAVLLVLAALLLAAGRAGLPEYMLADSVRSWFAPKSLDLPPAELQRWRDSGLVDADLEGKSSLRATAARPARNLILVYLESLGERVIVHPDYPGLMPNLERRLDQHALLRNYYTSAFITIEGIANSQCGTLVPFEHDSDSLAGFDGVAEQQACLGDVLHRAGYTQVYLGGAELSFAGKGYFLAAHGYDEVLGFEHWQEQGLAPRPGGWGLGDPDLFEQAWARIERLHESGAPFNLTLLTIGSHLPGFDYEECRPYGSSEPFIEALHCTDQLLEGFLARIEAAGYLEDTVVVVTADHHIFPNPLMQQLFGKDAVSDRRLPLLILGKDIPKAAVSAGAGFDLAPSILDLLGVESSVRFALGRSMLRAGPERDYFPTRYLDIAGGKPVAAGEGDCSGPVTLPLSRCDKQSLMTLLRHQNAMFSAQSAARLECDLRAPVQIRIPDAEDAPLQFLVSGEDQADRFSWMARSGQAAQHGLFVAALAGNGDIIGRDFIPETETAALAAPPELAGAERYILAWHGHRARVPDWLGRHGLVHAAVVLRDARGNTMPLPGHADTDSNEFVLTAEACDAWLAAADSPVTLAQLPQPTTAEADDSAAAGSFCPIRGWGPKQVFAGERFNAQPDGSSAFWLRTDCAPADVMLEFDGQLMEVNRSLPVLTTGFNADRYLLEPGEWPVGLYDPATRQRFPVGTLKVEDARAPIDLPEPPARVWPRITPPIAPPRLIAHAGGAWNGIRYANSREALDANYALGHRVFELDFAWTRDQQLVLIHDWGATWRGLFPDADHAGVPDHAEFLAARMREGQTQLDLARLGDWLRAHPDAWVVTDSGGSNLLALQRIATVLADVQARIIPQMTRAHRYPEIRALGYEQVIYTLYSSSLDTEALLDFIRATPLFAVTLNPEQRPDALHVLAELGRMGIPAYVHTYNEPGDLARFRKLGAHGLYTDFLHLDARGNARLGPGDPVPDQP